MHHSSNRGASSALLLYLIIGFLPPVSANATMPLLTDYPTEITNETCASWASKQDDDALTMWGLEESGRSSKTLALKRLSRYCMDRHMPDIVTFYSSAGAAETYCHSHPSANICSGISESEKKSANSSLENRPSASNSRHKAAENSFKLSGADAYVGCVLGLTIPLIHGGAPRDATLEHASTKCEKLTNGIAENELEGASDFINLSLDKIFPN